MSLGGSLFLIAVGAILNFAVTAEVAGIELQTVGVILMVIGGLGLVLTLGFFFMESRRQRPSGPGRPL
jgi:Flp pilus assembly protein protease CpaA